MMSRLLVTLAARDYEYLSPLATGDVEVDGGRQYLDRGDPPRARRPDRARPLAGWLGQPGLQAGPAGRAAGRRRARAGPPDARRHAAGRGDRRPDVPLAVGGVLRRDEEG